MDGQPKNKKQSTSTTHLVVSSTSTSTQATEIATATVPVPGPTKLDALPDDILINIAEFTGAHSCYLGYGAVNKRINQLFNIYSTKLSKSTSYGGYAPYKEIVQKCKKELKRKKEYEWWNTLEICPKLASGAVTFNREELLIWAMKKKNKFLYQAICERALEDEKLSIFKKIWESITNENIMSYMKQQTVFICIAAEKGNLNWLIYLHEEIECDWDEYACSGAARGGHLDCLVYLHEQGCPWGEYACSCAAEGGHLDCLKYLHEHECEWDEETCFEAALGGHLDCLVYLHEQGCPWNYEAFECAAENGHLDCLEYMRDNGL